VQVGFTQFRMFVQSADHLKRQKGGPVRQASVGGSELRWSALILRLGNRKTDYLDPLKEGL